MILKCTCVNEYQDKLYGNGNRVFNRQGKDKKNFARCTICGNSVRIGDDEKIEKKVEKENGKP